MASHSRARRAGQEAPDVFIGHGSGDARIAIPLAELLRSALNIPAGRIRCTSVDRYRLV